MLYGVYTLSYLMHYVYRDGHDYVSTCVKYPESRNRDICSMVWLLNAFISIVDRKPSNMMKAM